MITIYHHGFSSFVLRLTRRMGQVDLGESKGISIPDPGFVDQVLWMKQNEKWQLIGQVSADSSKPSNCP
jgi:hypothetical protein